MRGFFSQLLLGAVLLALLPARPLAAQSRPPASARPRYWEANADSLRRVLAGQRADTARLRTLRHLADLQPISVRETELTELVALTARLHRPDHGAYRRLVGAQRLPDNPAALTALLDSLQATVAAFDSLGHPAPVLLIQIRVLYNALNRQEAKLAYYQAKLAFYEKRHATENMAACCHGLGGYYLYRGDCNQSISYYLRSAELYRPFYRSFYYNEVAVIGASYVQWGNYDRAMPYLRQAVSWAGISAENWGFLNRAIADAYRRQHRYPLALRYADRALRPRSPRDTVSPFVKTYGLVLKSAVLLAQGRVAEAGRLLPPAQRLADSLHISVTGPSGDFELNATWARYYAAHGEPARAETYWLAAYRQARESRSTPLCLAYSRELGRYYQQRGQPAPAARYALAATALADSLETAQGQFHVAQYEGQQAERAQNDRITGLRQKQTLAAARDRQQRLVGGFLLGGVVLLLALAAVFYYAFRRSERLKRLVTAQKQDLQAQRDQLDTSLTRLQATQAQLVQAEKMAGLGELTAGIAHEIQNPLNFVNNFSEVSAELLAELKEAQAAGDAGEVTALADDLTQNLQKITQHGQRAAAIVRGMLEHSRQSSGERTPTDVNALADEYLRLAYHGLRAKDKAFNAALKTDFAPDLPPVEAVAGDLGRVLLNLLTNAFYAVQKRLLAGEAGYQPAVGVATKRVGPRVEICVSDNGTGMSPEVQAKIFQPFFTTKPTGEGTGLGLSLSHDIIAQGHGGTLAVHSQESVGTEFVISLPL
ncbi:ATP-binding protein [Hymenobacter caeli]|uniref:histidine kinase n=1 Tax=Hymenobacter caeli TaxID=2735894 RepID=A0ABX2FVU8_9BACT|nr:ATP-binding protein [Hymenobacter caeli]NRT21330.1 signal transduction histidine kinase [Hymenobacter caeli]